MLSEKEGFIMTNNQRICYVVGAMSLSPSLRPYPAPGDYVIAADRGYDSLMALSLIHISEPTRPG